MHGKDPFSEFREFIKTMESLVQELGKDNGVEHFDPEQYLIEVKHG